MIKEIIILATAFMALSQAVPIEDSQPEAIPKSVPVEQADADAKNDDLAPEASAWGGYGTRYHGGGYGLGGWGRGYGGGWGNGWSGLGGGWGGYRGGWGRGYGSYWG